MKKLLFFCVAGSFLPFLSAMESRLAEDNEPTVKRIERVRQVGQRTLMDEYDVVHYSNGRHVVLFHDRHEWSNTENHDPQKRDRIVALLQNIYQGDGPSPDVDITLQSGYIGSIEEVD